MTHELCIAIRSAGVSLSTGGTIHCLECRLQRVYEQCHELLCQIITTTPRRVKVEQTDIYTKHKNNHFFLHLCCWLDP